MRRILKTTSGSSFMLAAALAATVAISVGCAEHVSAQADVREVSTTIGNESLHIQLKGSIERLSDDGRDVEVMAPGSELTISQGGWLRRTFIGGDMVVLRALADGSIQREYFLSGRSQPYYPDGAGRLAVLMPRLVSSGIATKARVDQLLRTGGPGAVLQEVAQVQSDYVQAAFIRRIQELPAAQNQVPLADMLTLAGEQIGSDYELGRLLRELSEAALQDPRSREAFFTAAGTMASDYELQRLLADVISEDLNNAPLAVETLAGVLAVATKIDSDYEMSRLLQAIAQRVPLDPVTAEFFKAAGTIASDYELRRTLDAVVEGTQVSDATLSAVLDASVAITSDYELSRLLTRIASNRTLSDALKTKYLAAADTIASDHEQSRALAALVRRSTQ